MEAFLYFLTCDPLASASEVLGLWMDATMSNQNFPTPKMFSHLCDLLQDSELLMVFLLH